MQPAPRPQKCLYQSSTACPVLRCQAVQDTPLYQNRREHKSFLSNKLAQMQNLIYLNNIDFHLPCSANERAGKQALTEHAAKGVIFSAAILCIWFPVMVKDHTTRSSRTSE